MVQSKTAASTEPVTDLERIAGEIDRLSDALRSVQQSLAPARSEGAIDSAGAGANDVVQVGEADLGLTLRGAVIDTYESDRDGVRETARIVRRPDGRFLVVTDRVTATGRQTIVDPMPFPDDLDPSPYVASAEERAWLDAKPVGAEVI